MRAFSRLVGALERTRRRDARLALLVDYFREAAPADAAWAAFFLSGRKLGRPVTARTLLRWAARAAEIPEWLAELSYEKVGDLAETAALVVGGMGGPPSSLSDVVERTLEPPVSEIVAVRAWRELDPDERIVWNKLASGGFRSGVSSQVVARALAEAAGVAPDAVAHRLEQPWRPSADAYARLVDPAIADAGDSRPYPPASVEVLVETPASLGDPDAWLAEWKWNGIRAQLVRRGGRTYLWTRDELVTERFPEVADAARALPDGIVLDGELVANVDGRPLPASELLRRDGRTRVTPKMLTEAPVAFVAFDLLERGGVDRRNEPLDERRAALDALLAGGGEAVRGRIVASTAIAFRAWDELDERRADARARGAAGLVLKRRDATYAAAGAWRAWTVEPLSLMTVLLYVERASPGPEYTFAVWEAGELVPLVKTSVGVDAADVGRIDRFARFNTIETFGPVRRVRPMQVFELAFEAVERAARRKAGVTLRAPRVVAWHRDAAAERAATLDDVRALLEAGGP